MAKKEEKDLQESWEELKAAFHAAVTGEGIIFGVLMLLITILIAVFYIAISVVTQVVLPAVIIKWAVDLIAPIFHSNPLPLTYWQAIAIVILLRFIVSFIKE